jgi:TP901 family phage tail tape measure protein
MGREGYLLAVGTGVDIDRRSGDQAIGWLSSLMDALNLKSTKKATEGIVERNRLIKGAGQVLEEDNKKAEKIREDSVKASSERISKTIKKGMPRPPKQEKGQWIDEDAGEDFEKQLKIINKAYKKFADAAAKEDLKVGQAGKYGGKASKGKGGFGTGTSATEFGKQQAEDRKKAILLTKDLIEKNNRLNEVSSHGAAERIAENEVLEQQAKDMIRLDEEAIQHEKSEARTKKTNYRQYKKDVSELGKQNKQELHSIKVRTEAYKKLGKQMQSVIQQAGAGMKNAFIIGTAAIAAFAYKLQPVIEQVTKFERTIINANSVFGVTREELHSVTDEMVQFGLQYGVSTQDAATGLYQLASAGLSAAESQEVLRSTLLLSMATQGDHNTLAKLTVQTIMGFGMEMSEASILTDKFAHTIQKSLVEWQDLASSVKFAMPFFVATGQSIDQLLGGIEVLSNRALEAGIAGRGLRQALAQIAKHANDNEDALRKMGLETMNADGSMRSLTEIATDAQSIFTTMGYSDVESLTAMLESMNVRGATAFALLAQNADEFNEAVVNLQGAAGEATAMADLQQQSLEAQIQRVKTALIAPFLFSDKVGEANDTLNTFTLQIKELVDEFIGFFIVGEKGNEQLTEFSYAIRDFVLEVMKEVIVVVRRLKDVFLAQEAGLDTFQKLLTLATKPLLIMLNILDKLGPNMLTLLVYWKVLNSIIPFSTLATMANTKAMMMLTLAQMKAAGTEASYTSLIFGKTAAKWLETEAVAANTLSWTANWIAMTAGIAVVAVVIAAIVKTFEPMRALMAILIGLTVAWMAFHASWSLGLTVLATIAAMGAGLAAMRLLFGDWGVMDNGGMFMARTYDNGGKMTGGPLTSEHGLAMLQTGETVIPRTQNMLDGGASGGININISGDVYDGDVFADKIADVLPKALNSSSYSGSLDVRTFEQGASLNSKVLDRRIV